MSRSTLDFPFWEIVPIHLLYRHKILVAVMRKSQHTREYKRLIDALRKARESVGLTQEEVAQRLGTYASFVSKCESGERRVDAIELAAFCRMYEVNFLDFLKEVGLANE
jgi:ribosome-binding protein aMBF1 (putative translation factor)